MSDCIAAISSAFGRPTASHHQGNPKLRSDADRKIQPLVIYPSRHCQEKRPSLMGPGRARRKETNVNGWVDKDRLPAVDLADSALHLLRVRSETVGPTNSVSIRRPRKSASGSQHPAGSTTINAGIPRKPHRGVYV